MHIYPITDYEYDRLIAIIQTNAGKKDFAKAAKGATNAIIICRRLKNAGFEAKRLPLNAWNIVHDDWA